MNGASLSRTGRLSAEESSNQNMRHTREFLSDWRIGIAIMASHSLAIAKASLAAGMIRPDPTSIPKAEIAHFHILLEAVLKQCSSANIQV